VTSAVKYYMLMLLQWFPDVSFPPNVRVSFPSKAGKNGLRAVPIPHTLLEANTTQAVAPAPSEN
ncbi:hypothetical protein K443DRAFT_112126, partial [Laccaria amethystina LaAM-08-1]